MLRRAVTIFCLSLFLVTGMQASELYKIIELGDGKGNPGPVKLEVNFTNKKTGFQETIFLETLKESDINALAEIRTSKPVFERYDNHRDPGIENSKNVLENRLLPRVGSGKSVFPFVLKNDHDEVKGLVNIGDGYESSHRMFGFYMNSGDEVEGKFQEWGTGRGKAAVHAAGAFMMLWHKDHPQHQEINFGDNTVRLWGNTFDILSATSDVGNIASRTILETLGMKPASILDPRIREYYTRGDVGEKIYYELTDINDFSFTKKS